MKKQVLSSIWFLMAFLMLIYNAYMLNLMHKPVSVVPLEVEQLKSKLNRLSFIDSKIEEDKEEEARFIKEMFRNIAINKKKELNNTKKEEIRLPILQGILKTISINGKVHMVAVINGNAYIEKQKVDGFLIEKITEKGVYLTKYGKKWFIKIPDVKFSVINE